MKRSWVAAVGLVLLAACSSGTREPSPGSGAAFEVPPTSPLATYDRSRVDGYSLDYPSDWTKEKLSANCPAQVCFFAPEQDGQVPAVIAVHGQGWRARKDLQAAWDTQRQFAVAAFGGQPRMVPRTQGDTTLGGTEAKTATYTLDWGLIPATARQTMVLRDGKSGLVLREMAATDIWDGLNPVFEQVEASFTVGT